MARPRLRVETVPHARDKSIRLIRHRRRGRILDDNRFKKTDRTSSSKPSNGSSADLFDRCLTYS
jgi:hypothetical protein